jgi:hypothetical protein
MNHLNAQQASNELRPLDQTEIDAVSGAKGKLYDMGIFGNLWIDGNCAVWSMTTLDGNGGWTTTSVGHCS